MSKDLIEDPNFEEAPLVGENQKIAKIQIATYISTGVQFVFVLVALIYGCVLVSSTSLGFIFGQVTTGTGYIIMAGSGMACLAFQAVTSLFTFKQWKIKFLKVLQVATIAVPVIMVVVLVAAFVGRDVDTIGPIVIPFNNGADVFWFTFGSTQTKLCIGGLLYYGGSNVNETKVGPSCSEDVKVSKLNYHALRINQEDFKFSLFGKEHTFSITPKDEVKFTVITDVHQNEKYAAKVLNDTESDFVISCGDMTDNAQRLQVYKAFKSHTARSFAQAMGNHEAFNPELNILQGRERNYHQEINGHHFFFLFTFNSTKIAEPSVSESAKALEWLELQIKKYSGLKFIVSHQPVYSTGQFGAFKPFTEGLIALIDRHPTSQIMAVFTGHEHSFSTFKRNDTYIFVNGLAGGGIPEINSSKMGDRRWNAEKLEGPLKETEDSRTIGYQYHLHSFVKYTKTIVEVNVSTIKYTVIDLDTNQTIQTYVQDYDDLNFYGPILTPYQQGANITWRTSNTQKTMLCVNDVLYYGTNRSLETKQHPGCDFVPDVPALKHHSLFIPLSQFSVSLMGKELHFDNTPKDKVKFIVTTDVHQSVTYAQKAYTNMEDYDFHINGGDTTYWSRDIELATVFKNFHTKPYIQAVGNHESCANQSPVQIREDIFHQVIKGINFYFLFVFDREHVLPHYIDAVSEENIKKSLEFLESHLKTDSGPKFIVSHYMHYSTGQFGSHPSFTNGMNNLLEKYHDKQIVAILSGHDHIFAAFKHHNIHTLVCASGGGGFTRVNDTSIMLDRVWNAAELHGPLPKTNNERSMGYEYHLDSWTKYTRTEIEMANGHVTFTVRDLTTWEVVAVYQQDY